MDALGRTLKVEQKAADLAVQILEYSYATNGFVKTMKYPSGRVVNYAQSNAGRTVSATGSGAGEQYASGLTYGANGAMLGAVWNGTGTTRLVEARSYNWLGQMLVAEVKKGGTELKWKITNEYGDLNNNGNLNKQWTETGAAIYGVRFAYDAVNRIRGAAEDAPGEGSLATASCSTVGGTWCVKYRADGFGNLWTENKSATAAGVAAMSQAAYDAATNRLTAAGYYANGNQKHWVLNEAKSRAEYDADGKMVKAGRVTENEGTVWDAAQALTTLTYNGAGQRVKKTVTQGAATQTVHYVYGLDGEVAAEWESAPTGGGGRQYLVGDHLGSTRVRLDANGEVLQRIDYEPFGTEVQRTGVSGYGGGNAVSRKFTGKERDGETGLDYFGARYLSGAQGRFTSADPLLSSAHTTAPQSWNRYAYALNNPLRFTDPHGLYICSGTTGECRNFEAALKQLERARNSFKKGSAEYNSLNGSLQAYGKKGVDNGVTVKFGTTKSGGAGDTGIGIAVVAGTGNKAVTADNPSGQNTVVTFDLSQHMNKSAALDIGSLAVSVAHEGIHSGHGTAYIGALPIDLTSAAAAGVMAGPLNLTKYATEFAAYSGSSYAAQGLGFGSLKVGGNFEIWNSGWKAVDVNTLRSNGINGVLSDPNGLYKVTPGAPGKKIGE